MTDEDLRKELNLNDKEYANYLKYSKQDIYLELVSLANELINVNYENKKLRRDKQLSTKTPPKNYKIIPISLKALEKDFKDLLYEHSIRHSMTSKYDINWELYEAIEVQGNLKILGQYKNEVEPIGYMVAILSKLPHDKSHLTLRIDTIYSKGILIRGLIEQTENLARLNNCNSIIMPSNGKMLHSLLKDYEEIEIVYKKDL